MKEILVTGGAGYVGSNLIRSLIDRYQDVRITSLDNYYTGTTENHIQNSKVTYIEGNTWDINNIFEKNLFDIIFHFGEYSRIVHSFDDIDFVSKSIVTGTLEVLKFSLKNKSKIIYSASSSKFGNNGRDENLSPYSYFKSKNIELIKNYNSWFGLSFEIVYFFNVYGKNHIAEGKYATVIAIFENLYKLKKRLTVVSPGTQSRDFTHIDDIVSGLIKIHEKNLNHEWHLRSGVNTSILELVNYFESDYVIVPERRGERFTSEFFDSDTNEKLGWNPSINLFDYIKSFVEKNK